MDRKEPGAQKAQRSEPAVRRWVAASPRAVFEVLGNGWLYPAWVVGASRMRDVDQEWPRPGAELHHSIGVWPLLIDDTTTVEHWDPNRKMVLRARGWPAGEAIVEIMVEPVDDGCQVAIHEDVSAGPGLALLKPVRRALIRLRNQETLRRLQFLAEGSAGSTDGMS